MLQCNRLQNHYLRHRPPRPTASSTRSPTVGWPCTIPQSSRKTVSTICSARIVGARAARIWCIGSGSITSEPRPVRAARRYLAGMAETGFQSRPARQHVGARRDLEQDHGQVVHVPVGERRPVPLGDRAVDRRPCGRRLDVRGAGGIFRFRREQPVEHRRAESAGT